MSTVSSRCSTVLPHNVVHSSSNGSATSQLSPFMPYNVASSQISTSVMPYNVASSQISPSVMPYNVASSQISPFMSYNDVNSQISSSVIPYNNVNSQISPSVMPYNDVNSQISPLMPYNVASSQISPSIMPQYFPENYESSLQQTQLSNITDHIIQPPIQLLSDDNVPKRRNNYNRMIIPNNWQNHYKKKYVSGMVKQIDGVYGSKLKKMNINGTNHVTRDEYRWY